MTHKSSRNLIIAVGLLTLSTLENLSAQSFEPGCRMLDDEVTCRFDVPRLPIQVTHEAHGNFFLATKSFGADFAGQAEIISTASKTFQDTSWFTTTAYSGLNPPWSVDRFASDRGAQREASLLPVNFSNMSRDWLHSTDIPIDGNNIPVGLQMRALGGIRNVTHTEPRKVPIALPIPATFWLFGTALIGFISISRRRIL